VDVAVGVAVGTPVGVAVGVAVGTPVGVAVGVALGTPVGVGVAVAVGVGPPQGSTVTVVVGGLSVISSTLSVSEAWAARSIALWSHAAPTARSVTRATLTSPVGDTRLLVWKAPHRIIPDAASSMLQVGGPLNSKVVPPSTGLSKFNTAGSQVRSKL
jgi:hypothetical protein